MNFLYKPWKNGSGFIVKNNLTPKLDFVDVHIRKVKNWKYLYDVKNIPMKLLCKTNLEL